MIVKLLTEHHLECLSLKGGCRGSSESTHVKMPHCWKSHVTAQLSKYSHLVFSCALGIDPPISTVSLFLTSNKENKHSLHVGAL